jgi:hypothetical protein
MSTSTFSEYVFKLANWAKTVSPENYQGFTLNEAEQW